MSTKMAFEGRLYIGTADGTTTASTLLPNITEASYSFDPKKAPTTIRGDGTAVPLTTERVVELAISIEWTMLNKTTDTELETLRVAAAAGSAVALRLEDFSGNKGFDGDVTLAMAAGEPQAGEQTLKFTATPTNETAGGRQPVLYT